MIIVPKNLKKHEALISTIETVEEKIRANDQ